MLPNRRTVSSVFPTDRIASVGVFDSRFETIIQITSASTCPRTFAIFWTSREGRVPRSLRRKYWVRRKKRSRYRQPTGRTADRKEWLAKCSRCCTTTKKTCHLSSRPTPVSIYIVIAVD